MESLQAYAETIHAQATKSGFWEDDRNFGEMLMLATSELAEALEEHRDGKPTIYWKCKTCGMETQDDAYSWAPLAHTVPVKTDGIIDRILNFFKWTARDFQCPSMEVFKPEGASVELMDCMIRCMDTLAHELKNTKYSLDDVVKIKMSYNSRREYKHGKAY
jgi:hypothetical protein